MTAFGRQVGTAIGVIALLLVAGCGFTSPSKPADGRLAIVTSFYPLAYVAEHVAANHADVTNLTKPGAEPHDLELTPRQVASLTTADLVVYEKGFQAAVDNAVKQSENDDVLDTSTVVPLQDHGPLGEQGGPGRHVGNTNLDPHVWLDPTNLITIAATVADRLTQRDPDHAADYTSNAAALTRQLKALDSSFRNGLRDCERTEFITSHAAFGYLAERYGLRQIPINSLSPDSEPSPARIATVQRQIASYNVNTIFYETLTSPAVANSIAGDLGLRTDVLDPIEGITEKSRGDDYIAVMQSNLAALQQANGCR